VKTQIWIAVSVYVLVAIIRKRLKLDASLYTLMQVFSVTVFEKASIRRVDRDRGTPHGATPPTPPGIRVSYHGGSIGLSVCRDIEPGETK
jgi:hypothetical protein